jgi:glycosyltransferase involved in cell wall biosynthesis
MKQTPIKLFIQIPCLNEEKTLPLVLAAIPKSIPGVRSIDIVVIDDGSDDKTVEVAKKLGVKHFVYHPRRQGLAQGFQDGLMYCLAQGADIIVNTDGDNQYPSEDIPRLIKPIMDRKADMVIADRQVHTIKHFSTGKKFFQKFGTWVLNKAANTSLPDAPSGFRAYSRDTAFRLNVVTRFSYAMETLIQAGNTGIAISSVPITVNPKTRESRLFNSSAEHVLRSGSAIFRAFVMYRPYTLFLTTGLVLFLLGVIPFGRFLWGFFDDQEGGRIQSLIFGAVLMMGALISLTLGVIADMIRINRIMQEKHLELSRRAYVKDNSVQ